MPKSRKRVRANVRLAQTQKPTVTYTFDEELELWFAVVISHNKIVATLDEEDLGVLLDDVVGLLSVLNLKNADHLVDRVKTPSDKQVFAVEFLQSKLF